MTLQVSMCATFGAFLAGGEQANAFRFTQVEPALARGERVIFDFEGVTNMNDSFANALFGNLIKTHPELLNGRVEFKNCTPLMRELVGIALQAGLMWADRRERQLV